MAGMTEPSASAPNPTASGPRAGSGDPAFDALRGLILAEERDRLDQLETRLSDPNLRAEDVSSVLAEAMEQRSRRDNRLGRVMAPLVEEALLRSVKENPQVLAEALFPVIGPAIRRAVAALLEQMLMSVNRSLEYSISPRGLGWRLEAMRTGRPFAEIVLLKTLEYRVEQVFLIHRDSGALLAHASQLPGQAENAPIVSAMMNAIQDFVRDSFRVGGDLHTFEVGDLTVRVEQGPQALLAGVVRGTVPQELGYQFQDALEVIHLRFREVLDQFQGDPKGFEAAQPILERCLETRLKDSAPQKSQKTRTARPSSGASGARVSRWALVTLGVLVVAGLGFWWYTARLDADRWGRYVARLRAEPGLIVLSEQREAGRFMVRGLRDPLAASPAALLNGTGIDPARVNASWTPYQALEPTFVLARAREALQTPDTVTLSLENTVLVARGQASLRWLLRAKNLGPTLPGVRGFDDRGIVVGDGR